MPLCEHNTLGECAHKYAPSLVLISISVAWWSPSFSSTILQGDDRRPTKTDLFWLPLLPATQAQSDAHQQAHFASWLTYLSCLQSTSQSSLTDFFRFGHKHKQRPQRSIEIAFGQLTRYVVVLCNAEVNNMGNIDIKRSVTIQCVPRFSGSRSEPDSSTSQCTHRRIGSSKQKL